MRNTIGCPGVGGDLSSANQVENILRTTNKLFSDQLASTLPLALSEINLERCKRQNKSSNDECNKSSYHIKFMSLAKLLQAILQLYTRRCGGTKDIIVEASGNSKLGKWSL